MLLYEASESTEMSFAADSDSFFLFIKQQESRRHPIPDRRTIRIYADRLVDQIGQMDLAIQPTELGDILNRLIYPATLSEIGLVIDRMITKYDDEALDLLIQSDCGENFLLGFILTAGIAPILKEESKAYLRRMIQRNYQSPQRIVDLRRRLGSALELIRFIELNTYEEDVVADLIVSSEGGVAFCAGILNGYCRRMERNENTGITVMK